MIDYPDPVTPDETDEGQQRLSLRRAAQLTGALGALFALLFLASLWFIAETPGPRSSNQELVDFYASSSRRRPILIGLYLVPFSAVAFLWFVAALRQWIEGSARRLNRLLGTVQILSAVAFITLVFAGAGASTVLAASVEFADAPIDPVVARQFPLYGNTLLLIFGMRMAAIFVTTTTSIGRNAGLLPRWFVLASFAVAAFLFLSATLSFWLVAVFPLWILVLVALIFQTASRIPADAAVAREPDGGSAGRGASTLVSRRRSRRREATPGSGGADTTAQH